MALAAALIVAGRRARLWRLQSQQPVEHSLIGTCHVHCLGPARCPRDQRDGMTADTERGGHRGEGFRRGAAIDGALADPDDQRAIVVTADARTGRAGPHPDGNAHPSSMCPALVPPAGWQRLLKRIPETTALAAGRAAGRSMPLLGTGREITAK